MFDDSKLVELDGPYFIFLFTNSLMSSNSSCSIIYNFFMFEYLSRRVGLLFSAGQHSRRILECVCAFNVPLLAAGVGKLARLFFGNNFLIRIL